MNADPEPISRFRSQKLHFYPTNDPESQILDVRITQNKRNAGKNLWSSQTAGSGSECMYLSPEPVAALQVRWRTEQLDTETHCSDLQNQQRQKKKRENVS